jgi:hypothetical protein
MALAHIPDLKGNAPADLHGDLCGHGVDIGHPSDTVCAE